MFGRLTCRSGIHSLISIHDVIKNRVSVLRDSIAYIAFKNWLCCFFRLRVVG